MFTKEDYLKQYTEFYDVLNEGGSGGADYTRSQEYYEIPVKGGFKDGMSLLDYGCGWGAMCVGLNVDDYYGVDIIPKAIDLARKHFPDKKFDVLEVGKLKCEPKDFCISLSVFTHCLLEQVDDCLKDISSHTKKGAVIDILEGDDKNSCLHVRYWNKDEFIKKLNNFGFVVNSEFKITAQYGHIHTYLVLKKIS